MSSSTTPTPATTVTEPNSGRGDTDVDPVLLASSGLRDSNSSQERIWTNILLEANDLVSGERSAEHGHPAPNLDRIAALWHAAFGWDVTGENVALAMVLFKVARAIAGKTRDNLVDIAGYARVIEMIWDYPTTPVRTSSSGVASS
jgi:hypothetical protein